MPLLRSLLLILLFTLSAPAQMTWSLASGNESWPADKRAAIVAAMTAAVDLYNANGYFEKTLWANYSPGVPTAQASYSGWIDFGGSIGTRVALHEISHTLGVGVYWNWDPKISSGKWTGTFAINRVKLFDGASATVGCDTNHFWPYGLNYDTEDGTTNRVRHIKMVSALRRDMGIVTDSDGDGIPNDWEMFHFGNLNQTASGDADGDGTNNLAEYNADTDPAAHTTQWTGTTSSDWTVSSNWTPTTAPSNGTFYTRLNVNNAANNPLIYDAARGTTIFRPAERGLVIGSGGLGNGAMIITGGSFSTIGADGPDVIGNSGNTASLTIDGGSFASDELHLGVNSSGTGTLTLNSGSATIGTLSFRFSTGSGTVNLNGGTLTTARINRSYAGTANINLDSATIRASADEPAFLENLTNTFIKSGGVTLDTSTHSITIAQPLKNDPASPGGGITKSGTGPLVLTGPNTYTGATQITAGTLEAANPTALGTTDAGVTVANTATLSLSNNISTPAAETASITGAGAGSRGALQSASGANIWNGPVTIDSTKTRIGVQDGASLSLTGSLTEAVPATAVIFRAGLNPGDDIIVSNPTNSWSGATIAFTSSATGGALKLGATDALPATSPLLLAGNAVQGRLDLNGYDQTVAGLTNDTGGSSPIGTGIITNTGSSPSILTLAPTTTRTFIGTIQDGSQPVHLVKSGASTQILTTAQAYTGNTTVTAGTLRIDAPYLADSSTIAISSGAKLHLNFSAATPDTVASLTLGGTAMPAGTYNSTTHPANFIGTGSLNVTSGPTTSAFSNWINLPGLTSDQKLPAADPDNDGSNNLAEFAFGGNPTSPTDNGQRQLRTSDSDGNGQPDLTLTLEVRTGTTFAADGPDLLSTPIDGITYRIQGGSDLSSFGSPVSEVTPHLGSGVPKSGYVFKTFRLNASEGLPNQGFLRASAHQ